MIFYVIIIVCIFATYVYQTFAKKRRVPSGLKEIPTEPGVPVLGVVNKIGQSLCNYLLNLSHKHGPIYRIRFGMRDFVVLNTYEYIKAALVDNGDTFSGRCKGLNFTLGSDNSGLVFIDGSVWAEQRSFVLKSLRDLGFGRPKSVEVVQDECTHMLEDLERLKGKSVNMFNFMIMYSINVISKFVLNKRFTRDDPDLEIFKRFLKTLISETDSISVLILMFPFLERNETLMKFILWITPRQSLIDEIHEVFRKQIKEHSETLDLNSEGNDLTDVFLIHQHRLQESSGNVQSFTEIQLVRNIIELLAPSYDISATLCWGFMFMAMYPDIQKKVYEEIINKIGNERPITITDKISLSYTQAVLDEIVRLGSADPIAFFHRTLNDVSVNGYFIPKDTVVIPNALACHLDPNTWEHPLEFYPEHFLARDDNGELKYQPRDELIPFSMGKRRCIGESLSKTKYFIFLTSIIRRFRISSAVKFTNFDLFHPSDAIIRTPEVKDFILESRQ